MVLSHACCNVCVGRNWNMRLGPLYPAVKQPSQKEDEEETSLLKTRKENLERINRY